MDILSYILGKKAGGGGGEAVLINKNISANGTYNASADSADGYKKVEVSVPASAVDTGTKSITSNGNGQDVVGYASIDVDVPNSYSAGDEGKVVSDGALVSQGSDTVTSNGTVDTTLIGSLTVNVSGISWDAIATNDAPSGVITLTCSTVAEAALSRKAKSNWKCYSATVTTLGYNAFANSAKLTAAAFPNLTDIPGKQAFQSVGDIVVADLGKTSKIDTATFKWCGKFSTLILRKTDGIQALSNTNGIADGTLFKSGGSGGTVYIPEAMYNHLGDGSALDYKAATNWATVNGYGTITWAKLEGSQYEATDWILS